MRKIVFCVLFFLLSTTLICSHMVQQVRSQDGLIAWWKFDEGSGTTAFDSSGNGKHGTLMNGPTWTSGKINGALQFDATDDYVAIPDLYSSSPSALTVAAWIKSPLTPWHGEGTCIIHHFHNGEFGLGSDSSRILGFGVKLTTGAGYDTKMPTAITNVWHHVVGVWTKGAFLKIYLDGVLVNQTAVPDYYLFDAYWISSDIGGDYNGAAHFFDGIIDDIRVYNRSLSADEIMSIYLEGAVQYDVTIKAHCNTEGVDVPVPITKDGVPDGSTPQTFTGLTGTHTFTVPWYDSSSHRFKQWSTGSTNPTITVSSGGTYIAYYEKPSPGVGGVVISIDKLGLLAPYFGLASIITVASVATAVYAKRVQRKREKQ